MCYVSSQSQLVEKPGVDIDPQVEAEPVWLHGRGQLSQLIIL